MVLGGHGDQMVPVVSATSVGGVPLRKLVAEERIAGDGRADGEGRRRAREADRHVRLVRARRGGGADGRLDHARREARAPVHRSTSRASTASTASTWASRCKLGAEGIEQIFELDLADDEQRGAAGVAAAVREVVGVLTT